MSETSDSCSRETKNVPSGADGAAQAENQLYTVEWMVTKTLRIPYSICTPGVPQIMAELGSTSPELSAMFVSIYALVCLWPLAVRFSLRNLWVSYCNIGFVDFIVACALAPSLNSPIVFRLLSGIFSSYPITNGGGSLTNMVSQEQRATYMALFNIGPLLCPIVGSAAGGFSSSTKGWRWVFWLAAIVGGFLTVTIFFFLRETYTPTLLQRKTEALRKGTGNSASIQSG
ncbi:hypothetical protein BBP40_009206 [Aspergillus hancockii]|nr:hypothetical protein BBP40_009206 [Aspergillus hancockii]